MRCAKHPSGLGQGGNDLDDSIGEFHGGKKGESFNLERTLEELAKITEQISAGKVGLEESLRLYEKGMTMVTQCRAYLDSAENRIKVISQKADGLEVRDMSVNELKGG